jgi:uncharacterized protein
MADHNHVDLVELPAADPATLTAARTFYASAFGWSFTEYGDQYVDTSDSGVALGLNAVADAQRPRAPLTVLYVTDLEVTRQAVLDAGGTIAQDIYPFPGGRRFHFIDPAGNELAAWSENPVPRAE